mgnify:CR=1 FL=1
MAQAGVLPTIAEVSAEASGNGVLVRGGVEVSLCPVGSEAQRSSARLLRSADVPPFRHAPRALKGRDRRGRRQLRTRPAGEPRLRPCAPRVSDVVRSRLGVKSGRPQSRSASGSPRRLVGRNHCDCPGSHRAVGIFGTPHCERADTLRERRPGPLGLTG